jgi:predicted AAA+ superfamily ATPase
MRLKAMEEYKKRIADSILEEKLAGKGAVLIEGPKWCGKTTTAEQKAKSIIYMTDPKRQETNLMLASASPEMLLTGETPRLIDEWQIAPKLWDAIRFEVDQRRAFAHYSDRIISSSKTKEIVHSGTGRFSYLRMRPMSLFESGESNGAISLGDMFESPIIYIQKRFVIK